MLKIENTVAKQRVKTENIKRTVAHTMHFSNGFKNQTGPAGSIGNRPSIWSGYSKTLEIALKPVNSTNRPVQPENRKPERSDQFCKIAETDQQWSFFYSKNLLFSQIC